jgi:hypothetical protein
MEPWAPLKLNRKRKIKPTERTVPKTCIKDEFFFCIELYLDFNSHFPFQYFFVLRCLSIGNIDARLKSIKVISLKLNRCPIWFYIEITE